MLTKDLLKFRLNKGQIHPRFVDPTDKHLLELAETLISYYATSIGQLRIELEKNSTHLTKHILLPALQKLLEERCIFDDEEDFTATRWDWLKKAQNTRQKECPSTVGDFQSLMTQSLGCEFAKIKNRLYGDLPENRRLLEVKTMTPTSLLHRYNCSQVQGLLLHAKSVRLKLSEASLLDKRNLFRMMKFYRLLVQVTQQTEKDLCCEISGPLAIFDSAQSYGIKIANFFPYIIQCSKWQLTADIKIDKREGLLKLDHSAALVSHYELKTGYIPEEFSQFCLDFNDMDSAMLKGWQGDSGDKFIDLGHQSYCFPDFKFTHTKSSIVYLELFHRWHQGQILQRLATLKKDPTINLIIGICRSLRNNDAIEQAIVDVTPLGVKVFWFRDFPTPKQVSTQLP